MKGHKRLRVNRPKIIEAVKGLSQRLVEDLEDEKFETVLLEEDEEFIKISVSNRAAGCAFLFAALASEYAEGVEETEEDEKCSSS